MLPRLNHLLHALSSARCLPDVAELLFHATAELLDASPSALYLLEPDRHTLHRQITHNLSTEFNQQVADMFQYFPVTAVLEHDQPLGISDIWAAPSTYEQLQFLSAHGLQALLLLPIQIPPQTFAVLACYYTSPREWSASDFHLGMTLAHIAAIALQNIHLFQAELDQRRFAEAIARAAASVNSSLELDRVLDLILAQTIEVIQCQSANIMLIQDEEAAVARSLDRRGAEQIFGSPDRSLELSIPTLQQIITNQQPLIIPDTGSDERWSVDEVSRWIKSYAAAPLIVKDEIIGFLNMNSSQVEFFPREMAPRLQAFAATAATAIQNARLYRELQQHSNELEARVIERTSELSLTKHRLEQILQAAPDAVFVLDIHHQPVRINPAGEALQARAAAGGMDLFDPEYMAEIQTHAAHALPAIIEVQGRAYQALASILPEDDEQFNQVVVFRDVTRFRELDEMKSRFIADVSHELRTPLTNLSLYLDLLETASEPERRHGYFETLRRETDRLTHLIENLLTVSRLEARQIELDLEPVDVVELISNLILDRAAAAVDKDLELTQDSNCRQALVMADIRLLTQALSNLLTNALSYTPPGGTVHLETSCLNQVDGNWIEIQVCDSGPGISTEEQARVFERFYRGAAGEKSGTEGTGLGLAISRDIIDRLGGRITLTSESGAGSTFTVWLPAVL